MIYLKKCIFFVLLTLTASAVYSQFHILEAHRITETIHLDGRLNEAEWGEAKTISSFWMNYPYDTLEARSKTEVQILLSETHLYIGAICRHDESPYHYVVQSLKRDFSFRENEAFSVFIDAFNDATSAYSFTVNPYGAQSDGLIANGGSNGPTKSWDGLWRSEVNRSVGHWSVEMAIPLKTLRYNEYSEEWSINFARNDLYRNEISTWVPVARGFEVTTLASMGKIMLGVKTRSSTNAVFIPYAAGIVGKEASEKVTFKSSIGADAKIAISSSLYLDATALPDFSQVEVDRQVIDLSRFELFYPERRLFFLENSDLFASLGNKRIHPFFSRRIGGAGNESVPIHFGARVSGKINKKWRLGLMTIQTELPDSLADVKGNNNFSVGALQRSIFSGSTITAFMGNRQVFSDFHALSDFNRVAGVELDFHSKTSRWSGKSFAHRAFNSGASEKTKALSYSTKMRYKVKSYSLRLAIEHADENYITDMGYVPRLYHENEETGLISRIGYTQWRLNAYYRFFLEKSNLIDFISPDLDLELFTGADWDVQEKQANLNLFFRFMDASEMTLGYKHQSQFLFFPFSISGFAQTLPSGKYPFRYFEAAYDSGKRKQLYYVLELGAGQQYGGKKYQINSELNYRIKHHATIGLSFSHKKLYGFSEFSDEAQFNLIGSKAEISFNKNIFFTTYLQYNTQTNNININSRFQWRFRPLSDLYLVYTENYWTETGAIKNRALVLKMKYWWGI